MAYFLRGRIHDYDFLRWGVFTFAGGGICAVAITAVVGYYMIPLTQFPSTPSTPITTEEQLQRLSYLANLAASLTVLFAVPILLSFALTSLHPKKHIIPPFFIQMIAYPMVAVIAFPTWSIERTMMLILFGLTYPTFVAPLQDKAVTMVVGVSGDSSKMVSYSLRANGAAEKILEVVSDKKYRDRLRLDSSETKKIESGHWRLRSPSGAEFVTMLELKNDVTDSTKSIINVVFYLKRRYSIELTTDVQQAARMRVLYLKEILEKDYLIDVEERNAIFAQSLLKDAEDDLRGISKKFEKIPKAGWYQTIAFSVAMVMGIIISIYLEQYAVAGALVAPFAAYLIFDIPRKLKGGV